MEEIEVKQNTDSSINVNEESIQSETEFDVKKKDKKVKILPILKDNSEKSIKVPFKKLPKNERDEEKTSPKIVYPANLYSSLSFNWLYDVIKRRTEENPVKLSNLDEISPEVQSKHFYNEIMIKWYGTYNKRVKAKSTGYPLFLTLLCTNTRRIIISLILFFIRFLSEFFFVLSFKEIITRFNQNKKRHKTILSSLTLLELIFFMLINKCVGLISSRQIVFYVENLGKFTTVQLNCLIYDKLLKLASYNKGTFTEGQIINLIQTDSEKFGIFIATSPEVIILPFKLIYSVYILFSFFHESFVIGFILLIIMIYLFFVFGSKEKKYQRQMMKAADLRMNLTTQIFNIIKTIKLYVWENVFLQKIKEKRSVELDFMKNKLRMQIWSNFTYWIADVVLYSVSIVFYNLIHHQMDTTKIITGIYIVNDLVIPMFNLPHFIRFYFETIIGLVRIETFLSYKENDDKQIKYLPQDSEYAIIIENVDFGVENRIEDKTTTINKKEEENIKLKVNTIENIENKQTTKNNIINEDKVIRSKKNKKVSEEKIITLLKGINFKIKKGEHIGIIGEVGSGKTCLLNSIINNLAVLNKKNTDGNIQLAGKVSFVSQNSWILNDTIEQNILFFKPMDREKYNKIISICQLSPDLLIFPQGDQTEIGEKGVNLSGGQKARMAIARAVYNDSDIYVFDDPLSALDAYVGMNLFNQVFNDYLKDKTIIISTHALQYVSYFDRIFYIHQGEIKFSGEPKELENQQFYQEFKTAQENKKNEEKKNNKENEIEKEKKENEKKEEQLIQKGGLSHKDGEKISFQLFMSFIVYSGGIIFLVQLAVTNIIWQVSQIYREYYLAMWSSLKNITQAENNRKITYFVLMTIPGIVAVYYRQVYMVKGFVKYNVKMHDTLIQKLINAPINLFHDIIPRGNILNRLSKELDNSNVLSLAVSGTLRVIFQLIGSIIVCTLFNIWSLPLIIFLIIIELALTKFCFHATQDIHKLVSNYRAPILGVFDETLSGIPIIRAFHYEDNFTNKFYKKMDDYLKVSIYQKGIIGWYGVHLDIISFVLLSFVLIFAYFYKDSYSPQSIGLLLTYSIKMIFFMFDSFKRFSFLTELLISLERCDSYTKVIQEQYPKTEKDNSLQIFTSQKNQKIKSFISKGKINFINYSVKYREDTPLILKNINLEIKPGEKIGVCGRTGSGKSTMLLCLFRILEANKGKILIDDIDISTIGLEVLRQSLTIIPQEPILLEGNIRDNIDPSKTFNDTEILRILKEVGLSDFMADKSLDYKIEENGNNISVGEKQLICIARAMLKKTKIILMDEATANIDYRTEAALKKNIHEDMEESTVMTIAHRIKTIINYDRILVLKEGEIEEFDTPENLIEKKGLFYQLYKESMA